MISLFVLLKVLLEVDLPKSAFIIVQKNIIGTFTFIIKYPPINNFIIFEVLFIHKSILQFVNFPNDYFMS